MKRQIRRAVRHEDRPRPATHLAPDITTIDEDVDGFRYLLLAIDRVTSYRWDYALSSREHTDISDCLQHLWTVLKTTLRTKPTHVECDNEFAQGEVASFMQRHGVKIQPSAARTQAQNGAAERSGGVVITKARAIRGNLPHYLCRNIVNASVYLLNRIPAYSNR